MTDDRFEKMLLGDIDCIEEALVSGSVIDKFNAIISIIENNIKAESVITLIKTLRENEDRAYRENPDMTISNFAIAALDILEIEKYNGDDKYIRKLIKEKLGIT